MTEQQQQNYLQLAKLYQGIIEQSNNIDFVGNFEKMIGSLVEFVYVYENFQKNIIDYNNHLSNQVNRDYSDYKPYDVVNGETRSTEDNKAAVELYSALSRDSRLYERFNAIIQEGTNPAFQTYREIEQESTDSKVMFCEQFKSILEKCGLLNYLLCEQSTKGCIELDKDCYIDPQKVNDIFRFLTDENVRLYTKNYMNQVLHLNTENSYSQKCQDYQRDEEEVSKIAQEVDIMEKCQANADVLIQYIRQARNNNGTVESNEKIEHIKQEIDELYHANPNLSVKVNSIMQRKKIEAANKRLKDEEQKMKNRESSPVDLSDLEAKLAECGLLHFAKVFAGEKLSDTLPAENEVVTLLNPITTRNGIEGIDALIAKTKQDLEKSVARKKGSSENILSIYTKQIEVIYAQNYASVVPRTFAKGDALYNLLEKINLEKIRVGVEKNLDTEEKKYQTIDLLTAISMLKIMSSDIWKSNSMCLFSLVGLEADADNIYGSTVNDMIASILQELNNERVETDNVVPFYVEEEKRNVI